MLSHQKKKIGRRGSVLFLWHNSLCYRLAKHQNVVYKRRWVISQNDWKIKVLANMGNRLVNCFSSAYVSVHVCLYKGKDGNAWSKSWPDCRRCIFAALLSLLQSMSINTDTFLSHFSQFHGLWLSAVRLTALSAQALLSITDIDKVFPVQSLYLQWWSGIYRNDQEQKLF